MEVLQKIGRVRAEAVAMAFMAGSNVKIINDKKNQNQCGVKGREGKRNETLTREIYCCCFCGFFVDKRLVLHAISACLLRSATWTSVDSVVSHVAAVSSTCFQSISQLWGPQALPARIGKIYSLSSPRCVLCRFF